MSRRCAASETGRSPWGRNQLGSLLRLVRLPAVAHVGPAGVHPVALHGEIMFAPPVDLRDMLVPVHARSPVEVAEHTGKGLPARLRRVMRPEQTAATRCARGRGRLAKRAAARAGSGSARPDAAADACRPSCPGSAAPPGLRGGKSRSTGRSTPTPRHALLLPLRVEHRHGLHRGAAAGRPHRGGPAVEYSVRSALAVTVSARGP